jgi:hypothetical protein
MGKVETAVNKRRPGRLGDAACGISANFAPRISHKTNRSTIFSPLSLQLWVQAAPSKYFHGARSHEWNSPAINLWAIKGGF